jgi:hypothetical protein
MYVCYTNIVLYIAFGIIRGFTNCGRCRNILHMDMGAHMSIGLMRWLVKARLIMVSQFGAVWAGPGVCRCLE